jgi:hypothetical protein
LGMDDPELRLCLVLFRAFSLVEFVSAWWP